MEKLNITALIPMKAHSERIPNKNMTLFAGKPLYHHIVDKLSGSSYINKIIIDTDSNEISDNIKSFFKDVEIINRPENLCGDYVSMNKIIAYDLSKTNDKYFFQTHSTSPLIKTETIDNAIKHYFDNKHKYDSVFSVTKLQARLYNKNIEAINHNPDKLIRTQDLEPVFIDNSNFYIFSRESFANSGNHRIGKNPFMYEINKLEAIDIDEPEDLLLAEILYINAGR